MIFKLIQYYLSLHYWHYANVKSIKKMQLRKFRSIFEYAKTYSKFYKEYYKEHGVINLKINTWEDIKKVPIINKQILRNYDIQDIMTCNIDKSINIHSTSGSTGEPLKIAFNKFEDYSAHARVLWALRKSGFKPTDKIIMVTRYEKNEVFEVEKDISFMRKLQNKFNFFKRDIISIYEPVDIIISKLKESKAKILWSTPSIMQIVANRLKEKNIKLDFPIVFFTSEVITSLQEKLFTSYIGNYVVNLYGAMESPSIGFDFGLDDRFILFPSSNLIEFESIRENDKGERYGEVIITNFINRTMPMIRYNLKDICVIHEESGFPNKYIGEITGRIDDILEFPDGNKFVHHHAHEMFMDFEECEQFKFVQKGNNIIKLLLKPNRNYSKEVIRMKAFQRWNKRFAKYPLDIEFVERFEIDKRTGKFKNIEKIKT